MTIRARIRVLLAIAAGACLPATAWATSIVVYPFDVQKIEPSEVTALQAMIIGGIQEYARAGGVLVPSNPLVMKQTCGAHPAPKCLQGIAQNDVLVLLPLASQAKQVASVELQLIDSAGRVLAKTRFRADLTFLDFAPPARAMMALEEKWRASLAPESASREAKPPALAVQPDPSSAELARKPEHVPTEAATSSTEKAHTTLGEGPWKRNAGLVLMGAGVAMLLGGVLVGVVDRRLANSLENKYRRGALTVDDADSYARIRVYNATANSLFAAGAVATGVGLYFWISTPGEKPSKADGHLVLSGSF